MCVCVRMFMYAWITQVYLLVLFYTPIHNTAKMRRNILPENQENENRSAQSARNITVTKYNIQWQLVDCGIKRKREREGESGRV